MRTGHEFLEHVSETVLRVRAPDLPALIAEAGRALSLLQRRGRLLEGEGDWYELSVASTDPAALLVDWLNELIFLAEHERRVPVEFEIGETSETEVSAKVRAVVVNDAPTFVKAATMGGLRFAREGGLLVVEVTLDV